MINIAEHGKILAVTIEGVVLVPKSSFSPVSVSQAQLAGPWEPAAGIHEGKKKSPLNHYHLWNHSETVGDWQTDKPGNIVISGT